MTNSELFTMARETPFTTVLNNLGIHYEEDGGYYLILCPFHGDKKMGSFKISKASNRYHCYTCDVDNSWKSTIDFVQELNGVTAIQAAEVITGHNVTYTDMPFHFTYSAPQPKKEVRKKAEDSFLNFAYEQFIEHCEPLTWEQEREIKSWGVKNNRMDCFFNFPNSEVAKRRVLAGLNYVIGESDGYLTAEKLSYVPGFFLNENNELDFSIKDGIGMKQISLKGDTIALQIRMKNPQNGSKYKFFSSSWSDKGVSVGTVCSIFNPPLENQSPRAVAITEGMKKGLVLADVWKMKAIALNGVSSTKNCITKENLSGTDVCNIFFDTDWKTNGAVKKALTSLIHEVEDLNLFKSIYVCQWDESLGKGIDDVTLSGYAENVNRISVEQYLAMHA